MTAHILESQSLGLNPNSTIFSLCDLEQGPLWPEFSHKVIIKIKWINTYKTWEQCKEQSKCYISVYWVNKLIKQIFIYLLPNVPLYLHLWKCVLKGFHKWKGGLNRDKDKSSQSLLSFSNNTQQLFLSGRANYRSIPNLLVPTPTLHTILFKYCIHMW